MPHYNVSIFQEIGLEEVDEGQEYTPVVEAWWSGDADSPETAEENARAVWREKYDDVPPDDAEVKITPGPLVCPRCEGRGKLARYAPGVDPGPDWPLALPRSGRAPRATGPATSRSARSRMEAPLLTLDDGPSDSTGEIVDLLRQHGIPATFFVIGFRAQQRPDLVKLAAGQGHIVGNHTWDHVNLTGYSDDDVVHKLEQTNDIIAELLGAPPTLFRAPWLQFDPRVLRLAGSLGLEHVGANVDTCDYSPKPEHDAEYVANAVLSAKSGDIILLHDGNGDEREAPTNPPRPKTVEALRRALPDFAERWRERNPAS